MKRTDGIIIITKAAVLRRCSTLRPRSEISESRSVIDSPRQPVAGYRLSPPVSDDCVFHLRSCYYHSFFLPRHFRLFFFAPRKSPNSGYFHLPESNKQFSIFNNQNKAKDTIFFVLLFFAIIELAHRLRPFRVRLLSVHALRYSFEASAARGRVLRRAESPPY